jgi:hypothetical protein
MKKSWLFFFTGILLVAFTSAQSIPSSGKIPAAEDSAQLKTALIILKIIKQGSLYDVTVSSIRIVDGPAKQQLNKSSNWQQGDLLCFLTNNKQKILDTILIKQPLNRRYEYPGENGVIGSKTVELNETSVLIRCPYQPATASLQIDAVTANNKSKYILTLPFNKTQ